MKFLAFLTTLFFGVFGGTAVFAADCVTPSTSTQDSTHITISELYPAPASGEEEFIELYNNGSTNVAMNGWLLADESGKQYTIPDSTSLDAGAYLVLYHSTTGITLNNTGDVITLYNAAGETRSTAEYDSASNQTSWSEVDSIWVWTTPTPDAANVEATTAEGDATSPNNATDATGSDTESSAETQANDETSPNIHLSEALPNPSGSDSTDEWIEITNDGSAEVTLHNWQLTDQTTYYTIGDVSVAPGEYMVFEISDTGITLNNTGDTVYLIDPFGAIIHGTEYASAEEGRAWARNDDTWGWAETPTPNEANAFATASTDASQDTAAGTTSADSETADTATQTNAVSITAFRSLEDGQSATVEGVVSALPNVFGTQYFYIQDENSGVQVYSYNKAFPTLAEGDRVRVTGEKSSSRSETRIKTTQTSDIAVLGHGESIAPLDAATLAEEQEGMLVQIEGEVVNRTGSNVTVGDDLLVVVKSSSGISSSVFVVGTTMSVVGVVSQSDDSYRVMPRSSADVTTVEAESSAWIAPAQAATQNTVAAPSAPQNQTQNLLAIIAILGIAGVVLAARYMLWHRKQKLAPTQAPVTSAPHTDTPIYLSKH